MSLKSLHLLSVFFSLVLIYPFAHSIRNLPNAQKLSPYDFLKGLRGCSKGNSTKGLHKLKHYLHQFGYLNYQNQIHLEADDFDDALESALKTYQNNYQIAPTGMVDAATVSKMSSPRCGAPDVINGVNTMLSKDRHNHKSKSTHVVADFTFFPGSPRWPLNKTHLTYRFISGTREDATAAVARAFQKWESATRFSFSNVGSDEQSDLVIGFFSGDHGDGSPFDGPGPVVAHAFPPDDGRFHYDADGNWVNGAVPGAVDLETVALHEIGHLLGLHHSSVPSAIMYATVPTGQTKLVFDQDDLEGIRTLYNV